MTDQSGSGEAAGPGDRRDADRRGGDRRRTERRFPTPVWRRPWALVAYGVLGALAVLLLLDLTGGEEEVPDTGEVVTVKAPPPVDPNAPVSANAPPRDAYSVGEFERMLAEGNRAQGQRVRTELYCASISPVALALDNSAGIYAGIAELADANRRVPAAACRWGPTDTAPEIFLLVPPSLAERFAAAPEVMQNFVRRRRVRVELEWVGRSEALSLRNAGILTRVVE